MIEYSTEQVKQIEEIARRVDVPRAYVFKLLKGKKTNNVRLASAVSMFTGKPTELYLVTRGVKIDVPADTFPYQSIKSDEQMELEDLPDHDLLGLMQEVKLLQAQIGLEMRRRMGCDSE
jgi:hypothetical protein